MPRLFYRCGEGIIERPPIVEILREWESYGPDRNLFDKRIGNANDHIIAGYASGEPAVVLETIALDIACANEMPQNFDELTGNGTWETHKPNGRTIVLVDLTAASHLRGNGYAKRMRDRTLQRCWGAYDHIMTFSPQTARKFHEDAGAYMARELPNSRPSHSKRRDGLVMQYK